MILLLNPKCRASMQRDQVEIKARSLANLLTAFRSIGQLYPTREARRAWVERIFGNIRFDEYVRACTTIPELLPSIRAATIEFCLAHIGVSTFGERMRITFQQHGNDGDVSSVSVVSGHESDTSIGSSDSREEVPATITSQRFGMSRLDPFWLALYERLYALTVTEGTANDGYDARIEFARRFTIDLCSGKPAIIQEPRQISDFEHNRFVSDNECISTLTAIGYLNKSTMMYTDTNTEYHAYVYCSNCIRMHSDAIYTLSYEGLAPAPPVFDDEHEIRTFTQQLMLYTGGTFVPDRQACREAAVERNSVVITSFSQNNTSFQMAFAMPDSRFYTANIFYLKSGNTCSTDIQYKQHYLSNSCKCENRLSHWRVVVSVVALDGMELDVQARNDMLQLIVGVIRAFKQTKEDEGAHIYMNHFTGLSLVDYINDSNALGGLTTDVNIAEDNSSARTCYLHNWLRDHMNPRHWLSVMSPICIASVLLRIPQLLIVYRPVFSETLSSANGPNIFLNYKTFDDIVLKYLLLSLDTLRHGYADKRKGVAYKSRDNYWIQTDRKISIPPTGDSPPPKRPRWLRRADNFAGKLSSSSSSGEESHGEIDNYDSRIELNNLFRGVFSAPSRLYVHANVLKKMGFNVTGVSAVLPTRTFTHTDYDGSPEDRSDGLENSCTVICSSPMIIIDETTNRPEMRDSIQTLRVLKDAREFDSALEKNRDAWDVEAGRSYEESVVSLNDFWPGVRAIKISFKDVVLENVNFVFFAAADGCDSIQRLTRNGLTRLHHFNMQTSFSAHILPPPIVYTLQQMLLRTEDEVDIAASVL